MTSAASLKAPYQRGLSLRDMIERDSIPVTECGCWIWLGALSGGRYGGIKVSGRVVRTNRAAWIAYHGNEPSNLHVLHHCDMPLCVNPDHLFLGTHQDNMDDKERKGRGNQPSGDRNGARTKPWSRSRGDNHYRRRLKLARETAI